MNDWDRGRGRSDRVEDMGADRLLDRAKMILRELWRTVSAAEEGIDDAVRDLQRAEKIERVAEAHERKGEALERRAEGIEREALGDLTGTAERRERGRDNWGDWWGRGDGYLRDIGDGMRGMLDGRHFRDGDRVRGLMGDFHRHMRGFDRGWDGWNDRFGPVFDDVGRRWDGMIGRWDGRKWGDGDWGSHEGPFRDMFNEFDGFRSHWGRTRDDFDRYRDERFRRATQFPENPRRFREGRY